MEICNRVSMGFPIIWNYEVNIKSILSCFIIHLGIPFTSNMCVNVFERSLFMLSKAVK